jgi:L-serine dehydratase
MYKDLLSLVKAAKEKKIQLHQVILESEMNLTGLSEDLVYNKLSAHYEVMKQSAFKAREGNEDPALMSLIRGQSVKQGNYSEGTTLSGALINRIMTMAFSCSETNADMGLICAAPTAGACGVLPAVLIAVSEILNLSEKEVLDALMVASGVGAVIARNATLSGAEGGCQAECGSAAAMAAAAAVYMRGGKPEACMNAAGIALMNCMGLICDPVAGLVQLPCSFRNASQSVNALISADMALAGQDPVITPDEIIASMFRVGRRLPFELKETSLGGIAITPTGKKIADKLYKNTKLT